MPTIRGGQRSTWNRVYPVVYTREFEEGGPNSNLAAELDEERPGILAWLIRCSEKYLAIKQAGKRIKDFMPARALAELAKLQKQQDPLAEWMEDCCEYAQDGVLLSTAGFQSFQAYIALRGGSLSIQTQRAWTERMSANRRVSYSENVTMAGVRGRGFRGVTLKRGSASEPSQAEAF